MPSFSIPTKDRKLWIQPNKGDLWEHIDIKINEAKQYWREVRKEIKTL